MLVLKVHSFLAKQVVDKSALFRLQLLPKSSATLVQIFFFMLSKYQIRMRERKKYKRCILGNMEEVLSSPLADYLVDFFQVYCDSIICGSRIELHT